MLWIPLEGRDPRQAAGVFCLSTDLLRAPKVARFSCTLQCVSGFFVDVIAGPASGGHLQIGPGQTRVIGRSRACDLPVDDDLVSAQHLIISVPETGGGILLRDMRTTNGTRVIGADGSASLFHGETRAWGKDDLIQIGSHVLQLRVVNIQPAKLRPADAGARPSVGAGPLQVVQLSPARPRPALPPKIGAPPEAPKEPHKRRLPWVAMATSALGGLVMAAIFRMAFMLIFSVLAPVGMLLQFLWERRSTRRDRATELKQYERELAAHEAEVRAREVETSRIKRMLAGDPAQCRRHAAVPTVELWQFSHTPPSDAQVLIGLIRDGVTPLPFHVSLSADAIGVFGPPDLVESFMRWVALQITTGFSPSTAHLIGPWPWIARLPHGSDGGRPAASDGGAFVFEFCAASTERAGAKRARAKQFIYAAQRSELPAHCEIVLEVRPDFSARCEVLARHEVHEVEKLCGVTSELIEAVATDLMPLRDADSLPPVFQTLDELWGNPTLQTISAHWNKMSREPGRLLAPLGQNDSGELVEIDLARNGPHLLIGGTTGAGKSVLQRALIMSLALTQRPEHLALVLVDYKGGAAFRCLEDLPHVIDTVTDLDEAATVRTLESLRAELRRREHVLAEHGFSDHDQLADEGLIEAAPRLVIVVDELRALSDQHPELLNELVQLAALGRSLGVHLVLATQRPGSVVNADMRANINARIALRVQSSADSRDILDAPDAAEISASRPGSALMRFGSAPVQPLQVAAITDSQAQDLTQRIAQTARSIGARAPRRPWLAPLPRVLPFDALKALIDPAPNSQGLHRSSLSRLVVGLRDHASELVQDALMANIGAGHLMIAGGPGSGRTSALRALALAADIPVHVIAAKPAQIADAHAPWIGTCASIEDERLIVGLSEALLSQPAHQRLVLVDDADWLLDPDSGLTRAWAALQHLLRRGQENQITLALAGGRLLLAPRISELMTTRWILNWSDDTATTMGAVSRETPIPAGPGGIAQVESGKTTPARIAWTAPPKPQSWPDRQVQTTEIIRLKPLPELISEAELVRATKEEHELAGRGAPSKIMLGLGGTQASLQQIPPTSLLIAGPPGSGRTNALKLIASECQRIGRDVVLLHPDNALEQLNSADHDAVIAIDDVDLALSWDPHAKWVDTLTDRLRDGASVIAAGATSGWANSFSGFLAQMRRMRSGVILHPATRGSNEIFGLDVSRVGDGANAPIGRGVLVHNGQITALQMAPSDQLLPAKPRA